MVAVVFSHSDKCYRVVRSVFLQKTSKFRSILLIATAGDFVSQPRSRRLLLWRLGRRAGLTWGSRGVAYRASRLGETIRRPTTLFATCRSRIGPCSDEWGSSLVENSTRTTVRRGKSLSRGGSGCGWGSIPTSGRTICSVIFSRTV